MTSGFLIMLREGLEAALIVAIVLAYLKRLGMERHFRSVWAGVAVATVLAVIAGIAVFALLGDLHGTAEPVTEGLIAFTSAGVLTWMIFWMGRQARHIKGELHAKVDRALISGSAIGLATIAFAAILREGLESALYLVSTTVGQRSNAQELIGGLLGLAGATVLGYLLYSGSRKVNLRVFFRATGILIVLFAAGLVSKGIHEFQEVGVFGTANAHIWTLSWHFLNPSYGWMGETLNGLFGIYPSPSLEMFLFHLLYLVPVGALFLAQTRKMPARSPKAENPPAKRPEAHSAITT
ncbi:MAG: FTR1 family protein [Actinomycetota bacterium]|nr:FTR1 family protein [Actinomycetota bacterium]